jgi:hypothetical protein
MPVKLPLNEMNDERKMKCEQWLAQVPENIKNNPWGMSYAKPENAAIE